MYFIDVCILLKNDFTNNDQNEYNFQYNVMNIMVKINIIFLIILSFIEQVGICLNHLISRPDDKDVNEKGLYLQIYMCRQCLLIPAIVHYPCSFIHA